jgi:hypothetical protein
MWHLSRKLLANSLKQRSIYQLLEAEFEGCVLHFLGTGDVVEQ